MTTPDATQPVTTTSLNNKTVEPITFLEPSRHTPRPLIDQSPAHSTITDTTPHRTPTTPHAASKPPAKPFRRSLLAPENRTRNVEPPRPGLELLAAPGAEQALLTAAPIRIDLAGERDVVLRVPSLAGALFAKTTAWKELVASPDRSKHLTDAAQLLTAANLNDLVISTDGPIPPKALRRRWRWLQEALSDRRAAGWGIVPMEDREPALQRLEIVLSR